MTLREIRAYSDTCVEYARELGTKWGLDRFSNYRRTPTESDDTFRDNLRSDQ